MNKAFLKSVDTQSKKNVSRQRSQVETTTFRFENTYKTNPIKFNTEWTNYNTGVKDVDEKKTRLYTLHICMFESKVK